MIDSQLSEVPLEVRLHTVCHLSLLNASRDRVLYDIEIKNVMDLASISSGEVRVPLAEPRRVKYLSIIYGPALVNNARAQLNS
jgi:hypothetical protein